MPRPRRPAAPQQLAPNLPVVQLRVRLLGVAPMGWRRLVLDGTATLQELHGILQVAMGWGGIHLYRFEVGAVAFGSPELAIASPRVTLNDLRLRVGGKFRYAYDMGAFWRHEVRVEDRLAPIRPSPVLSASMATIPVHLRTAVDRRAIASAGARRSALRHGRTWPRSRMCLDA
jgi:hypothetical protein